MASPEVREEAIVLKKTKLAESDLILHLLVHDGSCERVVAKGARKPTNASSATLDLFNCVTLTIVGGKGLGIAKGSKLQEHHDELLIDPLRFAAASVMAELVDAVIQPDLPVPRLFDMVRTALFQVAKAPEDALPLVVAAFAFKLTALIGMRPSFAACACCGAPVGMRGGSVRFSYADGGAACAACATDMDTVGVSQATLALCDSLLHSTFADIAQMDPTSSAWDAASVAEMWALRQTGACLRSFSAFKTLSGCLQAASVI